MIPLSRHSAQILDGAGQTVLDPVAVSLTLDESWSPRLQGSLTIHSDDLDQLPAGGALGVRLRAAFGPDLSVAALTEWWGGSVGAVTRRVGGVVAAITAAHLSPWNPAERVLPLSAHTARWGGSVAAVTAEVAGRVVSITRAMRQPGGTYDPPPPQLIDAQVIARPAAGSERARTITLDIASRDVRLHDYRRTASTPYVATATSLRALVGVVLATIGESIETGPTVTIAAGATWTPGQTAWDYLHPILEATGWQLYADERGAWQLSPRQAVAAAHELHRDTNLTGWEARREEPYTAAVVEYDGGVYDIHAPAGAVRVLHERRDMPRPGQGAASELVARSILRGSTAAAEATSLYALRPLDRITCTPNDEAALRGTVESVTFDYPATTMRVALRDVA